MGEATRLAGVGLGSGAFAADIARPKHSPDQQTPQLTNQKMAVQTRTLCCSAFAVLHSSQRRTTPLSSASHLPRESVNLTYTVSRIHAFHAEIELPVAERSTLTDSAHSGLNDAVSQGGKSSIANRKLSATLIFRFKGRILFG